MSANLLATKLYRPAPPPRLVQRPHLIQRLNEGYNSGCQLTLISAPAGFGKSTCACEWTASLDLPVSWLALDPSDDDPARFLAYLIGALQKIDAGIGREIDAQGGGAGIFQAGQAALAESLVTTLLNDIQQTGQKFILVLDDFQTIKDGSILKTVGMLLANQPRNMHLVLITREDPQLPLARLRAHHQMNEIRAADLRFTWSEAGSFLNERMGLSLSGADITALEERTEGWVVGLQLAAIALQSAIPKNSPFSPAGAASPSDFIAHLSGSHRYILGYLAEEVLNRQPEDIQQFLLQTSILDKLNGDLCDAVTDRTGSQALLEKLFSANLFLIPLDDEGQWYRYHHLFANLLQAQLQRTGLAEAMNGLHRRAAAWYEPRGFLGEAIHHALAGQDTDGAARLVEQYTYPLMTRGELATLLRWMEAFPADLVRRRPMLLIARVWALLFAGAAEQIEALLLQAEAQIGAGDETVEAREMLGNAAAVRAFFALMRGDQKLALELSERAEQLLPAWDKQSASEYTNAAHSVLPYAMGMAYRSQGEYEKAAEAFAREVEMYPAPQDLLIWIIATTEVAAVRRMQGRLRESAEIDRRAAQRIAALGVQPTGAFARIDVSLSEVLREQNELEEAHRRVTGAIERVRNWTMPTDRLAYYLTLLRILHSQRKIEEAADVLRIAKDLRDHHPVFLDLSRGLDILEVRHALADSDLSAAARLMDALQPGASQIVFLREQELALLARLRLAQGRPAEALEILSPLVAEAEKAGRGTILIEGLALQALANQGLGNLETAAALLLRALVLGEPEGFARVFVDEGLAMQSLLSIVAERLATKTSPESAGVRDYIEKLLRFFPAEPGTQGQAPRVAQPSSLVEPLTSRELDVLRLIAEGLKYEEIAGRLFISVNTVRTYVKGIYGKLNVNNRSRAIALAREEKLI